MGKKISTEELVLISLMVSMSTVLNIFCPAIFLGMKPDFTLLILFLVIIMYKKFKLSLVTSITIGLLCAITTNFPGGQIPNIIDKTLTGLLIYVINRCINNVKIVHIILIPFLGSIFSGTVFLISASILVGLPMSVIEMVASIIIPLAFLNTIVFVPLVYLYKKISCKGMYKIS